MVNYTLETGTTFVPNNSSPTPNSTKVVLLRDGVILANVICWHDGSVPHLICKYGVKLIDSKLTVINILKLYLTLKHK